MANTNSIDKFIISYKLRHKIPALSIVILKNKDIIYKNGFGYIGLLQQQLATSETIYKWWSITKIITAIAIVQLHERNKLNIDDPVVKYLPFFKVKPQYIGNIPTIKIKHLLNHSSGLPDNFPQVIGWMHFKNSIYQKQSEFLKKSFPHFSKVNYEPGKYGSYTNVGYMLLGEIIKQVTHESYESYVIDNILKPLHMYNTHFVINKKEKNVATATHPVFSIESLFIPFFYPNILELCTIKNGLFWFKDFFPISTPPSGLIGSALEMAKLAQMILSGGILNGNRILNEVSINNMIYDHNVDVKYGIDKRKAIRYGLGWKIVNSDKFYIYHAGIGIGYSTMLRIYPKKLSAIILMTNTIKINRDEIIDTLFDLIDQD